MMAGRKIVLPRSIRQLSVVVPLLLLVIGLAMPPVADRPVVRGQVAATIEGEPFELWIPNASRNGDRLSVEAVAGQPGVSQKKPTVSLTISGDGYDATVSTLTVIRANGDRLVLGEHAADKLETASLLTQGGMIIFTVVASIHDGKARGYGKDGTEIYGDVPVMVSLQGMVDKPQ